VPLGFEGSEYGWGDGIYFVDKHVLEVQIPFDESPPEAWLSQIGYSGANPNNPSQYNYQYLYKNVSANSMILKTFFYFFKNRVGEPGAINIWVPHNPYDLAVGHTRVGVSAGPPPPQPPTAPTGLWGRYNPRTESIELEWDRNPVEQGVDYYQLDRADEDGGFYPLARRIWDPGTGDTVEWIDREIEPGVEFYRYCVKAHNDQGWGPFCYSITVRVDEGPLMRSGVESAPEDLTLEPNYPNPFNPTTQIKFGLPRASHIRLQIMNVRGQTIRVLVDEQRAAGWYTVTWDSKNETGRDVASGIYLYLIEADNKKILKKLTLIR